MLYLIIFLSIITQIQSEHTKTYKKDGLNNSDYIYFQDNTFGITLYKNPCQIVETNKIFREFVNQNIQCNGKWCYYTDFECVNTQTKCYHVERVIDVSGNEFYPECKMVAGNLVMIYGKWHNELNALSYVDAQAEKKEILGNKYEQIYSTINECCVRMINHNRSYNKCIDADNCDKKPNITLYIILFPRAFIAVFMILCRAVVVNRKYNRMNHGRYNYHIT